MGLQPPAMTAQGNGDTGVPAAWSAGVGTAALLVYLWLTPAVPGPGDSSELTLVLAMNGVAHPTGYPLYTLFGHLFVVALHALGGTWAFAANAWSAVGGGVAIALMHALGSRWIAPDSSLTRRARALVALLPVSLFAFNPLWTAQASLAEIHSWHLAWVLGAALAFLTIVRALAGPRAEKNRTLKRHAALWGLICGVGFAHHATAVWIVLPLSLAILVALWQTKNLRPRPIVIAIAAAVVPLLGYVGLYVKALHPGPGVWPYLEPTWASVLAHVTGAQYRAFLGHFRPLATEQRTLTTYAYPFVFPWLPLLMIGAARARGTAERLLGWASSGAVLLQLLFVFGYGVPDPTAYLLPPMAICLCSMPPLGAMLWASAPRIRRLVGFGGAALALTTALMIGPWITVGARGRDVAKSVEQRLRETWLSIPFERGIVLWGSDMSPRLLMYQILGGEKPGVALVNPISFTSDVSRRRYAQSHGFDPLEGIPIPPSLHSNTTLGTPVFEQFESAVGRKMQARTGLPVAIFYPRRSAVIPVDRFPLRDSLPERPGKDYVSPRPVTR